jgi:hypothetical protein
MHNKRLARFLLQLLARLNERNRRFEQGDNATVAEPAQYC